MIAFTLNMWLVAFILLAGVTAWLAWQNRAAEKVRQVFITSVAAGAVWAFVPLGNSTDIWIRLTVIAFAASAAIYLVALKQETRSVEFPTICVYQKDTKRSLESLNDTFAHRFCRRMFSHDPDWIVSRMELAQEDPTGADLYFDVLLRMIADVLFGLYSNTWDLKVTRRIGYADRTVFSESYGGSVPVQKFSWGDFQRLFPESRSLQVERFGGISNTLAVPPGTKLNGKTESIVGSPHKRTLRFDNPYVEVEFELTSSSANFVGIGDLGSLLGMSKEERQKFCTRTIELRLSAKFRRLKSGHPEMEKYRRWVDGLFEHLQEEFDSMRHWERGKDWFMMNKLSAIKSN